MTFTVADLRLPQPGGPGPRMHIPQEQGVPVIPPSTGLLSVASKSQNQSYVTTDGQSASLSWNKAPIWGVNPDFCYYQTVAGLLMWGALSDERTGLLFARVTVSSNKSLVSTCNLHFILYY
jgi:hypothetical protein